MTISVESTWTAASDWCPHPERWHCEDQMGTEAEVRELLMALVRALQPEVVVETGTGNARTAMTLAIALQVNGHGKLYTYETDRELVRNAGELMHGMPVTVMSAALDGQTAPLWVDMAYLDSGHDVRGREIEALLPRLAPGALIVVHDVGDGRSVWDTIRPLIDAGQVHGLRLRTPRGLALLQAGRE